MSQTDFFRRGNPGVSILRTDPLISESLGSTAFLQYGLSYYPNDAVRSVSMTPQIAGAQLAPLPVASMGFNNANQLISFNGSTMTHDADGNMTYGPLPSGAMGSYGYDSRNRLTSAGGLTYTYDAEGNRTGIGGTETQSFLVDSVSALPKVLQRTKNGITTRYVYGEGLLYELNLSNQATYYHFDRTGNTTALTNDSGAVVERMAYSPYGIVRYRQSGFDTPFLFNGHYGVMTDSNGLLNMRARYYNPLTCRFINSDPARSGWNWYAFCGGDPVNYADPFGLDAVLTLRGLYLGYHVNSSEFAGGAERGKMPSAYGNFQVNPDKPEAALPARVSKSQRDLVVANPYNDMQTSARVTDVGPFNETDAYWKTGARPAVEAQFANQTMAAYEIPSQNAAIDLTPAAMNNLGDTGKENSRQADVVWWFKNDSTSLNGYYPFQPNNHTNK